MIRNYRCTSVVFFEFLKCFSVFTVDCFTDVFNNSTDIVRADKVTSPIYMDNSICVAKKIGRTKFRTYPAETPIPKSEKAAS